MEMVWPHGQERAWAPDATGILLEGGGEEEKRKTMTDMDESGKQRTDGGNGVVCGRGDHKSSRQRRLEKMCGCRKDLQGPTRLTN